MASLVLFVPPAGCAEVEAAEELADEEDVNVFGDLGAQRGAGGEGLEGERRAQVGEAAEGLADLEKAGFGALVGGEGVELVVADGAEEDSVGRRARGQAWPGAGECRGR